MRFRRSKYGARKVKADGVTFDSRAEYARYLELQLLLKAGKISHLQIHKPIPLTIDRTVIGTYEADYVYYDLDKLAWVIEDVKGVKTDVYRLKKKILAANGYEITEINAKDLKVRRR